MDQQGDAGHQQQGDVGHQQLVRGVNWVPDSEDETDDSSASEVRFVNDSLAGDTIVPKH